MVHIRALLVIKVAGFDAELVQMAASDTQSLVKLAEAFSEQDLIRFFSILTKTEQDIRLSTQPRFQLEIGLMKLAHARRLYLLEDAVSQLADIQLRLGGANLPSVGGAAPSTPASSTGSGRTGSRSGSSGPRSTSRAVEGSGAEPPRLSSRTQPVQPEPFERVNERSLEEMPNPFAAASKNTGKPSTPMPSAAPPPEPPPVFDEPYDVGHGFSPAESFNGQEAVDRIKKAIEGRRKMMLLSALDHAQSIAVEGDFLRITFAPDSALFKNQVDSKDNRKLIEEISREVLKHKLTLSVSVTGQAIIEETAPKKATAKPKQKAEDDPRINALKEKFRGEVIEIKGRPN
jgi:DNA polymerase-3 subunit gamma/tau